VGSRGPVAKRNIPVAVLAPVAKLPPVPRTLGAAGKETWRATWTQAAPWLTAGDMAIVERLSHLADERHELLEAIAVSGRTAKGSMGQQVTHPHVDQLRQVEAMMLKHEQVLGLGASNRARLGISIAKLAEKSTRAGKVVEMYRKQLGGAAS
jgi:P27 family predicted phage terminase small subunit